MQVWRDGCPQGFSSRLRQGLEGISAGQSNVTERENCAGRILNGLLRAGQLHQIFDEVIQSGDLGLSAAQPLALSR